jgi:predicted DCC family thiol-disulfide oxidoreductase YuxK
MQRYLLAYDADCGPCTRFKRAIGFLDSYQRINPIPLTEADSEGVLDGVPPSRRHRSFHLVTPGGGVLSGAAAIPALVGLLPAGRFPARLMASAPGGPRAVKFVYQTFSRLHDSGSCNFKPGSAGRGSASKVGFGDAVTPRSSPGVPTRLS